LPIFNPFVPATPTPTPSANSGEISTGSNCGTACSTDILLEVVEIQNDGTDQTMDIFDTEYEAVGSVTIASSTFGDDGLLIIREAEVPEDTDVSNLLSNVVDVVLLDANGNEISALDTNVEICLEVDQEAEQDDLCLSFLDESKDPPEFVCQDPCVEFQNDTFVCGDTAHFTSFAVLLDGDAGGSACGSSDNPYEFDTMAWLSLVSIILACCCCIIWVFIIEVVMRIQAKSKEKEKEKRRQQKRSALLGNSGASATASLACD